MSGVDGNPSAAPEGLEPSAAGSAATPPPAHSAPPSISDRRAAVTREAIREAVRELLQTAHPAIISIPEVAARAGLSVRTIYRYFPSKQALLDDVANIQIRRVEDTYDSADTLYDDPAVGLQALWREFAKDRDAVQAQHLSAAGRNLRARRADRSREAVGPRIDAMVPDLDEAARADAIDIVLAIASSSAYLDLTGRLGRTTDDASRLAWWAIQALLEKLSRDGGVS